jgi:hypothetical protein
MMLRLHAATSQRLPGSWIAMTVVAIAVACGLGLVSACDRDRRTNERSEAGASASDQHARIERLLAALHGASVTFIRNGTDYTAAEAAAHLRTKWEHAGNRIRTAEDLIDQLGTRSSTSGRPYRIRLADGTERDAGPWLHELVKGR